MVVAYGVGGRATHIIPNFHDHRFRRGVLIAGEHGNHIGKPQRHHGHQFLFRQVGQIGSGVELKSLVSLVLGDLHFGSPLPKRESDEGCTEGNREIEIQELGPA